MCEIHMCVKEATISGEISKSPNFVSYKKNKKLLMMSSTFCGIITAGLIITKIMSGDTLTLSHPAQCDKNSEERALLRVR